MQDPHPGDFFLVKARTNAPPQPLLGGEVGLENDRLHYSKRKITVNSYHRVVSDIVPKDVDKAVAIAGDSKEVKTLS